MNNEDSQKNPDDAGEDLGVERRAQGRIRSVRQVVGNSLDNLTGVEARRQSEEFTNAVTTSVLGIHRDLLALSDRVTQVEQSQSQKITEPTSIISTAAVILSLIAIILSLVTLVVML